MVVALPGPKVVLDCRNTSSDCLVLSCSNFLRVTEQSCHIKLADSAGICALQEVQTIGQSQEQGHLHESHKTRA